MGATSASQTDLGVRGWKIYDGPDLVVLSFLDPGLFAARTWVASDANWSAHTGDLRDFRCRKYRGRLAFVSFDTAGVLRECFQEMRDARLRAVRLADCYGLPDFRVVACHAADWTCRSRSSRFFREFVHADIGPVPIASRRVRGWNWRHGRSDWRHADCRNRGPRAAMDRQLCGSLFHGSVGLPGRFVVHSTVEPGVGAGAHRSVVNQ